MRQLRPVPLCLTPPSPKSSREESMQRITSKDNEFVKHIKKLKDKKYRDINNEYVIEGIKLVEEAIQEKAPIKQIILCDDCEKNATIPKDLMYEIAKQECIYVSEKVFKYLSEVQTPQGILAVIEKNGQDTQIDYARRYYCSFR